MVLVVEFPIYKSCLLFGLYYKCGFVYELLFPIKVYCPYCANSVVGFFVFFYLHSIAVESNYFFSLAKELFDKFFVNIVAFDGIDLSEVAVVFVPMSDLVI